MSTPTSPESADQPRRRPVTVRVAVAIGIVAVVLVTVALAQIVPPRTDTAFPIPSGTPAPLPPSLAPTASRNPPPSEAELTSLATELGSGDTERLAPFLGADPDDVDPAFVSNLAVLGISIPIPADVKDLGGGIFEVRAQDRAGNEWAIGLRSTSKLLIVYAEPA